MKNKQASKLKVGRNLKASGEEILVFMRFTVVAHLHAQSPSLTSFSSSCLKSDSFSASSDQLLRNLELVERSSSRLNLNYSQVSFFVWPQTRTIKSRGREQESWTNGTFFQAHMFGSTQEKLFLISSTCLGIDFPLCEIYFHRVNINIEYSSEQIRIKSWGTHTS